MGQIGFEPDPWCEDGARNQIPKPIEKNRARGCHFIYEVRIEGQGPQGSFTAYAIGQGIAQGINLFVSRDGIPKEGAPPGPSIDLPPTATPSPGFDCAKASTRIEHLICGNPELARLDRRLGEVYKQVLEGTKPALKFIWIDSQRGWLTRLERACANKPDSAVGACLSQMYTKRIASLTPLREHRPFGSFSREVPAPQAGSCLDTEGAERAAGYVEKCKNVVQAANLQVCDEAYDCGSIVEQIAIFACEMPKSDAELRRCLKAVLQRQ